MSHTVLDGQGNLKYVNSAGAGTVGDPLRLFANPYADLKLEIGNTFFHSDIHTIANNGTFRYLIITPAYTTKVKFIQIVTENSPLQVRFYEDTITSANGAAESWYNANRRATIAAGMQIYNGPTVTSNGIALIEFLIPGDNNIGGTHTYKQPLILKDSTNYCIAIQNTSGGATNFSITIFIEE